MPKPVAKVPLFDPSAIEKLRRVAGDQGSSFVKEMAQLFLEETQKSLAELRRGSESGDWKQVTRLAHSLKSSAATFGLMRLSAACQELEMDTKGATSSDDTAGLVAAVFARFDDVIPTLKELS